MTPNFTLAELTRSSTAERLKLDNTPSKEIIAELKLTAELLEKIRALINAPILVTSAYRSPLVNAAVGGRHTSDHTTGKAADIVAPKYGTPYELAAKIEAHFEELGIGQLILEGIRGKQWVHVSRDEPFRAINKILTITDRGTFVGIKKL